ncbi:membrane protein [Fictibacillus barbaricus]|nr:membrane protein [Fictibacillus barbaricus]
MMKEGSKKIISALCYFSLFFAPFLFPIAVYFIADDNEVMEHAKKSFLSHILPIIAVPLGIIIIFETQYHPAAIVISALIFGTLTLIVMIWNIVKGIKVILS